MIGFYRREKLETYEGFGGVPHQPNKEELEKAEKYAKERKAYFEEICPNCGMTRYECGGGCHE